MSATRTAIPNRFHLVAGLKKVPLMGFAIGPTKVVGKFGERHGIYKEKEKAEHCRNKEVRPNLRS